MPIIREWTEVEGASLEARKLDWKVSRSGPYNCVCCLLIFSCVGVNETGSDMD